MKCDHCGGPFRAAPIHLSVGPDLTFLCSWRCVARFAAAKALPEVDREIAQFRLSLVADKPNKEPGE